MNCEEYRDLLNHYLDGEPAADGLVDHARQCKDCAALYRGAQQLTSALAHMKPPPAPPPYLTNWTLLALRDERRHRLALRLRLAACAIAAAMLLAVLIPSFWPRSNNGQVANVPIASVPQPTATEPQPTLRDAVNQAGQALSGVTARAADETVVQPLTSLPMPTPRNEWDKPPQLDPSSRPLTETGQSAVVALEPVTNSARRAFDMLLHELPTKPES